MYLQLLISTSPTVKKGKSIWKWIGIVLLVLFAALGGLIVVGLAYIRSEALVEAVYPNVTPDQMTYIEQQTGIIFPKGSVGLCYYYDHWTCIDPSMQVKVKIPSHLVDEFRSKELLFPISDRAHASTNLSTNYRPWWKPDRLNKIAEGEFNVDSASVEWTLGTENEDHFAYIHWVVF